jgi:hypothetical protein
VGANFGLQDEADGVDGSSSLPLPAEDELATALKGWSAFSLKGALNINLVCSGFVIRKGGPLGLPAEVPGPGTHRADKFDLVAQRVYGARFSTGIYPRGCHWFPHLLA